MFKYVITKYRGGILSSVFWDNKPIEVFYDDNQKRSLLGNIYIGKVQNIVKNLNAAFIEINKELVCYLSLENLADPIYLKKGSSKNIQQGDELLIQVIKDAAKTKQPGVSTEITFTGKYSVLIMNRDGIHISNKISKKESDALKAIELPEECKKYGWILRTDSVHTDTQTLLEEMKQLSAMADQMREISPHRLAGTCLLDTKRKFLTFLKNRNSSKITKIVTDEQEIYDQIQDYLVKWQPDLREKLELYADNLLPLSKLYSLETIIERIRQERVWLKSGGYLVIQPTEALTVIDVNTGKAIGKGNLEEHFYKINQEAAIEVAYQMRLRNLSGIIIVDFINMNRKEHENSILDLLRKNIKEDSHTARVVDITPLGLVEITRKREEPTVLEQLKNI